ncbi:MAG TPA: hypothetical protein VNQ14_00925 [Woeseiaceae bacterium]|nr:hypothetical protein [Woeseiaceae bacterium]
MTKCKRRAIAVLISGICAGGATLAVADNSHPLPGRLGGLINDYTPGSVKGGPYEMRGEWSLDVHRKSGTASFSAVMNMETSDWGVSKGIVDPDDPSTRGAHTHHITMTKATVTRDSSVCPSLSPATSGGFVVTGTAQVNGNGTPAPFESGGNPPSTIQICVTGGSKVALSNFTLTFLGLATGHFGTQAIHGVVTCTSSSRERTLKRCGKEESHSHDSH